MPLHEGNQLQRTEGKTGDEEGYTDSQMLHVVTYLLMLLRFVQKAVLKLRRCVQMLYVSRANVKENTTKSYIFVFQN